MAAYVIVDMVVTDSARYDRYRPLAEAAVHAHGGRYLARGGQVEVLEGDREPNRTVVLEFPDLETAKQWYHGEAYRQARAIREGAGTGSFIVVEGIEAR